MKFVACIREYSLRSYVLAITAGFLISSCGGSDGPPPVPPSISVSATSIDADVSGEDVSVNVSNGGEGTLSWTASIPSSVDWARISSGSSGTNAGTIQIEVDANTGAAREFELTVSASGTASSTVTVSQAEAPAVIDVSAVSTDLEGAGGSVTLQVSNTGHATMEWTASLPEDAEWAYIESGEAGTDSGEIVVRYDLNGGADRELEVTVTASAASNSPQAVTLSQAWVAAANCTFPEGRAEALSVMRQVYYFNDESEQQAKYENLDPADYGSLTEMLDYLQWMPETRDRGFTYWITEKQFRMLFDAQAFIFGFRLIFIVNQAQEPLHFELLDVFQGSPAADAGFERGDTVVALNGKAILGMTIDQINAEFGPNEDGYEVTFELEKPDGTRSTPSVRKRLVEVPTVPADHVRVFESAKGSVGYLHFRTFFGDAAARLLDEFARFKREGAKHVIIDLRYNGGGSVPIAHVFATLAGGPELFGRFMVETRHNNFLANRWNMTTYFDCGVFAGRSLMRPDLVERCKNEGALADLDNVVFITGRGSASASELIISALQPYENVTLVGDRTYGKPVGQYLFPMCEDESVPPVPLLRLVPVSFATANVEGAAGYYDGIPADCEVSDDRTHQLGDAEEGRIAAALRFIETGSCEAPASARFAPPSVSIEASPPEDPIKQFLGY